MSKMLFTRWKPFILMAMIFDEEKTNFSDFVEQLPISHKVLTENLKAMEAAAALYLQRKEKRFSPFSGV